MVSILWFRALIELCADICKRNAIQRLLWQADKGLVGQVNLQNMTAHRWFENKSCPGDYICGWGLFAAYSLKRCYSSRAPFSGSKISPGSRIVSAEHWLWNEAFYNAPVDDLRHIARLSSFWTK